MASSATIARAQARLMRQIRSGKPEGIETKKTRMDFDSVMWLFMHMFGPITLIQAEDELIKNPGWALVAECFCATVPEDMIP